MIASRDTFISGLYRVAKDDPRIILISVDMGAPALDQWRQELPAQFLSAGISEQNAVNVAAGIADSGGIPVVYFMAVWTARCFEQIRYSCAMPGLPVTVLGNGVGLGYAPAGPAHEATEDLAYMRSLTGIEIWSPSQTSQVEGLVRLTQSKPALRYLRFERSMPGGLTDERNQETTLPSDIQEDLEPMGFVGNAQANAVVCLLSSGYLLGRAVEVASQLRSRGVATNVIEVSRLKPLNVDQLARYIGEPQLCVTLEEQFLSGGFGSAILEALSDSQISVPILRLGLPSEFIFQNGAREDLLDQSGLSVSEIEKLVLLRLEQRP